MVNENKKYYLWVLGCQMNEADAERIRSILNSLNFKETNYEKEANIIITIACSVRQSAIDRIFGKARNWQKRKDLVTILTGCVINEDKPRLEKIFNNIIAIQEINKLPQILSIKSSDLSPSKEYIEILPEYKDNFKAYVPISTGCNNYCTYCVVPYTRGREKSRSSANILNECKKLIKKGYKEITLIGQNVNSYGHDLKDELSFPELLKQVSDLPGNFWVRFATSHPKDMSDELIDIIANNEKICNYIHLPVQSGDNEILKRMNRKYTREHYLELIDKIKKRISPLFLSTDIIVGFPRETRKQFKNSVKLFKYTKYDMAYIALYSPRAGTASYQMKDNVTKKEKKKRELKLDKVLKRYALKNNHNLIGETLEVLIDRKKNDYYYGKSKTFRDARCQADNNLIGKFVKIEITKAKTFSLEGEIKKE